MQTAVVYANRNPSQRAGGLGGLFNTCIKVWALASQPFDKSDKNLRVSNKTPVIAQLLTEPNQGAKLCDVNTPLPPWHDSAIRSN